MDSPAVNAVNDVINLNGNVDSGGLSRWVVYAIIAAVAAIAITIAVVFTRKKIQESREDGGIIKDVGEAITDDVSKQVADDMLEVAIRAQTESAQLSADMETAKQLFALGQVSQADVDKAVAAAEASKKAAIQKNAEAAKALEAFRKKELATANATVLEATKRATGLSQEYEKVSDGITEQKVKEANDLLVELVKKRQQAESDYNDALDTKKKAEAAFLESKKTKAENKRGIIATMNKKISDLKEKIKRAKISNPVPKPPAPQPPAPKPQPPRPPAPKPPAPKPPAPKPPVPKPPTALERKYPYWGWNEHAGLRCTNNNNTGCNTGYDAKGQLVDLNPDRPPAPSPSPSAGSVVLLGKEVRVNLSNKTIAGNGGRGFSQKWPIPSQFKTACKMSFDINFQPGFSFGNNNHSEGGKVGGLHVGSGAASGCRHTDSGSSLRLVWDGGPDKRFKGSGASAYTYIPTSSRGKQPDFVNKEGDPNCGLHLWRKESDNIFSEVGSWYHVVLGIKLNDVGRSNGKIYYSITGPKNLTRESDGFMWRTSNYDIREASISSFFGGGGNQNKVLPSTYLLKNVMLSPY